MPYLYPEARVKFPDIEPTVLVSVINTISAKYRAARFDMWRGVASLPVQREMPLPINPQSYEITKDSQSFLFRFRISGAWHDLILRGGGQFHRQHHKLGQIMAGELEVGEAALYEEGNALMLKIASWFPREAGTEGQRTIKARTCIDGLLIAVDGESMWRLNGHHMQRLLAASARQQQSLREDLKAERRFPGKMREGIIARMREVSERRAGRLNSWGDPIKSPFHFA